LTPRKAPATESIPATLSPPQAIALLNRQADRGDLISTLNFRDPQNDVWENATDNILEQAFGRPRGEMHRNSREFKIAQSGVSLHVNMSDRELQADHVGKTRQRQALLRGFIEQLQDLAPPAVLNDPAQYQFHSEILRVSGELLRDGHYKSAALEAYVRVIEQVKAVSGLVDDGDSLMNKAFGSERQAPVIAFNDLSTDAERDEQKGFHFLFKGIVGLRNSKAHSNRLFNDPSRAHEYLALASLLMRLLEIARVNRAG
jgi:uncharacterized protein (TIGR02391 family)